MDERASFRDKMLDYVKREFDVSLPSLPAIQQSKLMTRFYAVEVLRRTDPHLVPEDEEDLDIAIVDGAGDCGVDMIWRENDRVFIVQSKYHGKKADPKPDEFAYFQAALQRLYAPDRAKMKPQLLEAVDFIDWENDRFELHFLSLSKSNADMREAEKRGVSPVPEIPDVTERTDILLLDESDLNKKMRDADPRENL
jgi:hypothetical protein